MKDSVWWQLLRVFLPLSFLTIGGGQSILADIQRESVSVHHWLTDAQFVDDFAISRASAGPNTLIVTLIGWQAGGMAGAIAATFAIFVPPAILFYILTRLWRLNAFGPWRDRLARGLAPVSVGLVFAGTYSLLTTEGGGVLSFIVTGVSMLLLLMTRVHPLLPLAAGALVFLGKLLGGP
jgi:chromate transporter